MELKKGIISAWAIEKVETQSELSDVVNSFLKIGFIVKKQESQSAILKRGAQFGFTFDYQNDDGIEIIVKLTKINQELEIKVGNVGFPFEPLLSLPRYEKNAKRFADDIKTAGLVQPIIENEAKVVDKRGNVIFKRALMIFGGAIFIGIVLAKLR